MGLSQNHSTDSGGITSALHRCIQNSLGISGAPAGVLCCLRSRSHHKSQVSFVWEGGSFIFRIYRELAVVGFLKGLLISVSILEPLKTMALGWEGPALVLICFMGGLLAENFVVKLSRIRKRRTSEARGLEILRCVSDTTCQCHGDSPLALQDWMQPAKCWALPAPFTLGGEMAACRIRPSMPGKSDSPSQLPHKGERSSVTPETISKTEHRQAGASHRCSAASPNSWGFIRLDIVPAFGIHR